MDRGIDTSDVVSAFEALSLLSLHVAPTDFSRLLQPKNTHHVMFALSLEILLITLLYIHL